MNIFDKQFNLSLSRIVLFLLLASMFCISFDIFMTVQLAGFNFRLSQLILFVVFLFTLFNAIKTDQIVIPLGFWPLVFWILFQILFVSNTTFITRSIGYIMWMIFNLIMIFSVVNLITTEERINLAMKWYLRSFFLVGFFGIIQFISPIIGIGSPLITQWWIKDFIPRVNGFSYEPSYYATYLLTGWVLSFYLLWYKSDLLSRRETKLIFVVCTIAMILSSSRMGILIMGLFIGWQMFKKILTGKVNKWLIRVVVVSILVSMAFVPIIIEKSEIFLNGTGLKGTSSHSFSERMERMIDTIQVFSNSPFVGVSLGGVSPAIAEQYGRIVTTQAEAKSFEGMNIFAEVLAASGLIGVIPFILFFTTIYNNVIILSKNRISREHRIWLLGALQALFFLLLILQFNQNILRPYLWLHISMICALYSTINRAGG